MFYFYHSTQNKVFVRNPLKILKFLKILKILKFGTNSTQGRYNDTLSFEWISNSNYFIPFFDIFNCHWTCQIESWAIFVLVRIYKAVFTYFKKFTRNVVFRTSMSDTRISHNPNVYRSNHIYTRGWVKCLYTKGTSKFKFLTGGL